MYIKNIFNVRNYKGLDDGFNINFSDITYIIGDNAKNKSTIGSLPVWILTGYSLFGNNREVVSNDKENRGLNTIASMTIIDNTGSEHIITRSKGKDNCVMLDGIRTTQEIISVFYKDIHAFLCAYNPSYFRSMKLTDQRELLLRVLPAISSDYAFTLLEKEEQEILEQPVVDIKGFNKARRAEIKEMKSDLDKMLGNKNALIDIAIQKEDAPLVFEKAQELKNIEQEYERIIENTDNIITVEDLEKDIKKLDEKIKNNVNIELKSLQEKQKKELENFNNVSSTTSNCPVCKQPIQNENLIKVLKIKYKNNVNELADRIGKLKELKPDCLEDIIAGVSLYRPGPMDQIPRYIANKKDPEHAVYTHERLKPILNVTYGCMVYQEQVMQIVRDLAGYSLGRADLVRRAMGKKKLDVMAKEREIFINGQVDEDGKIIVPGCIRNGISAEDANKIFDEMAEFAKYAFNKSHAAAYAVLSYQTAYLKTYYPAEFMAAMLNSFLGNLDKIPAYIDECKRLNIEILKPDINKSYTKFTVDGNKIRFGLGSIKNVGVGAVDEIVEERNKNGEFKDFADFCERIANASVNKKCIESLIKAGAFDNFEQTRRTLMESFESIVDSISDSSKKSFDGQVSMFDLGGESGKQMEELKYTYKVMPEFTEREMLSMEKEMLGLYISGHPLEKLRHQIEMQTNINTAQMREAQNASSLDSEAIEGEEKASEISANISMNEKLQDGQFVKYAGIITSVKKKYTKNNKVMAFVTVEDLYGPTEIIVFENCYQNCSNILMEDNIVLVDGRLSIREDEDTKIVAREIKEFGEQKKKILTLDITNLNDVQKEKLRGAIKFFSGERNNIPVQIINGERKDMAGGIYINNISNTGENNETLKEFKEIVGNENARIVEV